MKKQSAMAFRAAAVLSSLALASAFVAYRSGASAGSGRSTTRPVSNPRSVSGEFLDDAKVDFLLEETQKDRRNLGGSKSVIIFEPEDEATRKLMEGSKSGRMIRPEDLKPAPKPQESKPQETKPATQPAPQPK